jgi:glycerate-2-kinase
MERLKPSLRIRRTRFLHLAICSVHFFPFLPQTAGIVKNSPAGFWLEKPVHFGYIKKRMREKDFDSARMSRQAVTIFRAALAEVDPECLIRKAVRRRGRRLLIQGKSIDLGSFENIFLVAFGKAAPYMAKSLSQVLGGRLSRGIAICRPDQSLSDNRILCLPGSHPLPDRKSVKAAQEILGLAKKAGQKDLVFVLISGGGSAQACLPQSPLTLAEKRWITKELLRAGASIAELNTLRKHISEIKGGRLAEAAFPAKVVNLVISDVIGNDLENIASGPSYWDSSTYEDAIGVLKKYGLWGKAPRSLREVLLSGATGKRPETLKRGNLVFKNVSTFLIGDNRQALEAAARKARGLGFHAAVLTASDSGEARMAARGYISLLENIAQSRKSPQKPFCLLAGGELTVRVKGKGRGGRNTEFVLAALTELGNELPLLVASLGSDGVDGATDAAGAWATPATAARARQLGLDAKKYLRNNDSYNFFKKAGGLIITGPTPTNVMDLRLFLL